MKIIRYRKIFYALSAILMAASLYAIFAFGLNLSIDFKGGTITEVSFLERPAKEVVEASVGELGLGSFSVRPAGEMNYIIRTRELNADEQQSIVKALGNPSVERQNTIGPVVGSELRSKALTAVLVAILMILVFITIAFRKVSEPVSSWKYALATIAALIHDVVIPIGIFVFLGRMYGMEIDLLLVSGILAILGFSVHDTIVVFDRVRESLNKNKEDNKSEPFEETVGKALMSTMARSINTSFTLLVVLVALYVAGSTATRDFSLLMILGTFVGAYSSIFFAAPLLVTFYKLQRK